MRFRYWLLAAGSVLVLPPVSVLFFGVVMRSAWDGKAPATAWLVLHVVVFAIAITVIVAAVIDASSNDRIPEDRRGVWVIGPVVAYPVAVPIYVWRYRRRTARCP